MAAAWKDAAVYASVSSGTTITQSYTTTTGADFLVVRAFRVNGETITGITFNGDALFQMGAKLDGNDNEISLWGLRAPDIGTYNVVLTKSAAGDLAAMVIQSASGIDQTSNGAAARTPASKNDSDGSSVSTALTTVAGDLVFDLVIVGDAPGTGSPGAGQTTDQANVAVEGGFYRLAASHKDAVGTSTTMSWPDNSQTLWAHIVGALVPTADASSTTITPNPAALGV